MRRLAALILMALVVTSCGRDTVTTLPALGDAQTHIDQGKALGEEDQYLQAIDHFSAAIQLEPDSAEAYYLRGRAHHNHASQVVLEATAQRPENAPSLPDEALQHLEDAVADYTRAVELDPQYATAYNNRGNVYTSLRQEDDALRDYEAALALDPSLALAYFNRGLLHYRLRDPQQAIADLKKYLELVPDAEDRAEVEEFIEQMRGEGGSTP